MVLKCQYLDVTQSPFWLGGLETFYFLSDWLLVIMGESIILGHDNSGNKIIIIAPPFITYDGARHSAKHFKYCII